MYDPTDIPAGLEYEAEEIIATIGGVEYMCFFNIEAPYLNLKDFTLGAWEIVGDVLGLDEEDVETTLELTETETALLIGLALAARTEALEYEKACTLA